MAGHASKNELAPGHRAGSFEIHKGFEADKYRALTFIDLFEIVLKECEKHTETYRA